MTARRCTFALLAGLAGTAAWQVAPAADRAAPAPAPASASVLAARDTPLRFEQVFDTAGESPSLHFRAAYGTAAAPHRLEVWREGDQRLVRRTDDAIETHAARRAPDPTYQLVVLDLQRKISTRIDRSNLYRIGNFTDWFDLGHGLRHPKGDYTLTATQPPADAPQPLQACAWYALQRGGGTTDVCWSVRSRLPMLLLANDGRVLWQVTAIDQAPIDPAVFQVRDGGFVHNDADADMSND